MAIKLSDLRKLQSVPPSSYTRALSGDEQMVVLVKLRPGFARPTYLAARGEFSSALFSAEVPASMLPRLETDPAVESVSISQRMPVIR